MAVSAVEMMNGQARRSPEWRIGAFTLALVVGKAAYEAITGQILFGFLYFGLVGNPIAVSHAGGIVGGLLAMLLLSTLGRTPNRRPQTQRQSTLATSEILRNATPERHRENHPVPLLAARQQRPVGR